MANGIVGRAEPVGGAAAEDRRRGRAGGRPAVRRRRRGLARGDFAAAVAEFDKLLQANPGDAEAKAGKAQAALFARAAALDPQVVLARARDVRRASTTSWTRPTSRW